VAVNPVTNKIYVANFGSNNVTVIDGVTNITSTVGVGSGTPAVAVNPVTNKIYAPTLGTPPTFADSGIAVIDGATNTTSTVGLGNSNQVIAVNPVNNKAYALNESNNTVSVIAEQQVQSIPLTTAISPLPNNTFVNPGSPTFNFTTTSTYSPNAPPVTNVYYQVDTWQGAWLRASGTAPSFSGAAPPLLPGIHIVYAYAADGQLADSIQVGHQSSSVPGSIASYVFLVLPAPSSTTLTLTAGTNPATYGQELTFTATVTGGGTLPTGLVVFFDGNTVVGSRILNGAGSASIAYTPVVAGSHSITAIYAGDAFYGTSTSAIVNQIVSQETTTTALAGDTQSLYGQAVTFDVTVSPQVAGTPTGTVTFYDGNTLLGTAALNGGGSTSLTTSAPLGLGTHSITAVYPGDVNFTGSTSNAITLTVSQASSGVAVALTMGTNPSQYGQALTFTATAIPLFAGVPTGQVTFKDGNVVLGTHALNNSGQASLSTAGLGISTHSITAFYTGDQNFTASDSSASPLSQTVNAASGTALTNVVLRSTPAGISPTTSLFRKTVTLTVTVTPSGATGTVSFMDGTTLLGTVPLNAGVASIPIQLGIGVHFIYVSYSGDATYSPTSFNVTLYRSPRPH
jgi:YVTN family beta-propeller protein